MLRRWWVVAAVCFAWLATGALAYAETVTVTIGVGDTVLVVQGKTSPSAFVTIRDGNSVIGTTTADADGLYQETFPAQVPGLHDISVYAHTTGGQTTDTISSTINVAEHATTTADIFLPPTIMMTATNLENTQPLQLSGEAYPLSSIKVFIDDTDYATATADAQGLWSVTVDTVVLAPGEHRLFVKAIDNIGNQSYASAQRMFTIAAPPTEESPQAPVPTKPVITFPTPGLVWTEPTITITGTAQPGTQIEVWDGDTPLGATVADANGRWAITITLRSPAYNLRVRACLAGVCSDFQQGISFSYAPPPASRPGMVLRLPKLRYATPQGRAVIVKVFVLYGQAPYKTSAEWGDGATTATNQSGNTLSFTHTYAQPGQYAVHLTVHDANGLRATTQVVVEVLPAAQGFVPLIVIGLLPLSLAFFAPFVWQFLRLRKLRIKVK